MTIEEEVLEPRKRPRQARSRAMVDALIEATARVLVEDGYDRASTNRIAKVAGVSVGSLYQYFPNKEALVVAVVDRHMEQVSLLVHQLAEELEDAPIDHAVRSVIQGLAAIHQVNPALHMAMVRQADHLAHPRLQKIRDGMETVVARWLERRASDVRPSNHVVASFVLNVAVRAVEHEMQLAPEHDPDEVLAELADMVQRYLDAKNA